MDITEEEELERITGMLQRDNLVRGVGIVEEVYKLLHCTPGTGGPRKDCFHHSVSFLWILTSSILSKRGFCRHGCHPKIGMVNFAIPKPNTNFC